MKQSPHKVILYETRGVVALTVGILVFDLVTPLGWAVWLLYFFPLVLTLHSPRERDPYYFAVMATLLIIVGALVSREGSDPRVDFFNRSLGIVVMWGFTWLMVSRKKAQGRLVGAEAAREEAEAAREVALGARAEAETSLRGALDRERHATEETGVAEAARQRAETKVLASKLRLEGVVQSAMDAIITVDDEQLITLFNHAAEAMFMCKADDVLGRPLDRLIPDRYREAHREHIRRFGQSGVTTRQMGTLGTITGMRSSGEEFPIEAAISQVAVDGKRYFTVILRDITERQKANVALQETTERMRLMMRFAPAALAMFDRNMHYLAFSQRWAGDYGLAGQDLIGRSYYEIFPEIPERWKAVHQRGLAGEVIRLDDDRFVRADGSEHRLRWEVRPWYAADGSVGGIVIFAEDVTEYKRAQAALEQSELRLQSILNSMEEVVWSSSLDLSELFYVSPAIKEVYGRPLGDFLANPLLWLEMIHSEDRPVADAAVKGVEEGRGFDMEYRIVRPDGGIRWIRHRGRIVRDGQGRALRIDGVAADVTDQHAAEQALKGAEERFEDIFEASKDAIGYASLDGTFVLANEAFSRLTGYSKQELLNRSYRDLTPPEYRELQAKVIAGVLQTGEPREYEKEYVRKDGSRIPVSLTVFAVKGDDGKPAGVAAIVRDVTERKQTEEALRTSAARLQSAIAAANVGTWMVDLKTKMDTRDAGLNRMLGLPPVESSQPLEDFIGRIHHEDRAACAKAWAEAIEVTRVYDVTHRIVRSDGEVRWFRNRGQVAVDAEDRPQHAVGACVDLTDQRKLEEQLRRTERIAELGTLASGMAHEIGTPMNVILGRAEYLMQRVKEEPIKKGLQTIVAQVERITKVMNQLLTFARRRTPERRALNLQSTVEDNLEMFQERLARAQVTLETSFSEACPMVHADPDQMSQVLINLVMNAIHAMPDGGTLRIALSPGNGRVLLAVSDTGQGIPKDVIAKIFDPFFTTKEFGKGTGLGLTVVKGIIEEHQGSITVESEPDHGTTFTISLPIYKS